jgi:hypothetical protein
MSSDLDLSTLRPGTARDMGPWTEPSGQVDPGGRTTFSSIAYDADGDQFVSMGGHHGLNITTTPRLLKPHEKRYWNPVATVPRELMTPANSDPTLGRWISHNHPWSRHTYQSLVVLDGKLYMLAGQNSHNPANGHRFPPGDGRAAIFDLSATEARSQTAWRFSQMQRTGWLMNTAAAPVGKRHILVLFNGMSNWAQCWLYSIESDSRIELKSVRFARDRGWPDCPSLVYFPPTGKHYAVDNLGRVYEIDVDPAAPHTASATQIVNGWPFDRRNVRLDYDPVNWVLGGCLENGSYRAFDPITRVWKEFPIADEAAVDRPRTKFWCGAFDQRRGLYVALTETGRCWYVRPPGFKDTRGLVPVSMPARSAPLRAELDFGGGQVAKFAGGTDIGDFVGEHVRQRCLLATDPAFANWRVMFRRDADGLRDEAIVEYGRGDASTPAHRTTPYTARIYRGDTLVHEVTVPTHWWDARWRWQSAPRKRVRTVRQLVERGWLPELDARALFGRPAYDFVSPPVTPMTMAQHLNRGMGTAGENQCIGPLTEAQADWCIRQDEGIWPTVVAEAESAATYRTHLRIKGFQMPDAGLLHYKNGTARGYPGAILNESPGAGGPQDMSLALSHWYPVANLMWLLTDDPYYLEELQFGVNWRLLWSSYTRINQKLGGLMYNSQTRGIAWALRDQFLLAATTPETVPGWLQPRATWKRHLDESLSYYNRFMTSKTRLAALFRVNTRYDMCAPWMQAYLDQVLGQAVRMGLKEWRPFYEWSVAGSTMAMTSGSSGWHLGASTPYYWWPLKDKAYKPVKWPVSADPALDARTHDSWADAFAAYASEKFPGVDIARWDDITPQFGTSNFAYILHMRAALASAEQLGVVGATICLNNIERQIEVKKFKGQARFAIARAK